MRLALASCGERLSPDLLELLDAAGLSVAALRQATGPGLIPAADAQYLLAPARDVLTFCALGGADAGMVGAEALLEYDTEVLHLLDLGVRRRRLVVATPPAGPSRRRPRFATRYPHATAEFFARSGREVEVVAVEAAPWLAVAAGVADGIVALHDEIPEDGAGLVDRETVADCCVRLVTGRQTCVLRGPQLAGLVDRLREARGGA